MRMIAYILAIICIIAAVMYFVMPAGHCRLLCQATKPVPRMFM